MSVPQRKSADWMLQLDERILEYIESEGFVTPKMLARESDFPEYRGILSDRCKRLQYAGFIHPFADEMYEITVEGRLYLKGDLDAAHQPYPKASAVHKRWSFPAGWQPGPISYKL